MCAKKTGSALQRIEVREYEGKDLSSVEDFRENSIKGPQQVDRDAYRLRVHGLVKTPLELTYGDVIGGNQLYKKVVTLNCVEGWSVDVLWEGVLVADLLDEADVDSRATTVIVRSYDGYSTSLPLDFVRDRSVLLAYKMNAVELPPERGFPFQVVAEEKWGYKWAKWVTEIELSSDSDFEGYWESRGYSTDGSLDRPSHGR
ncbi:MAG: molybdopterin-dependent oxidoreductase [Actinomycetota bacterium]|nr:molybdopterin-dependent oxidoreductase [Actinomycetota bacterium]